MFGLDIKRFCGGAGALEKLLPIEAVDTLSLRVFTES